MFTLQTAAGSGYAKHKRHHTRQWKEMFTVHSTHTKHVKVGILFSIHEKHYT